MNGIDERLKGLIQESVERWEQEVVQVEVMPDHVHLLVGCDPPFGIHRAREVREGCNLARTPKRVP